jgi:alkylation response protein AidB-like acyl-CoA dehydrogenase
VSAWTPEQQALRIAVRSFLEARASEPVVRQRMMSTTGYERSEWSAFCSELGVGGLATPAAFGGAGATLVELGIVIEELGRALACLPFLSNAVLSQTVLTATGDSDACERLLPSICDGARTASFAFAERDLDWACPDVRTTASRGAGGWRINGEKQYVIDGMSADLLLTLARTPDGVAIFEVNPRAEGVHRKSLPTVDLTRKQAVVTLIDTPAILVGDTAVGEYALAQALVVGSVCLSLESVGAAQHVMGEAVAYARSRYQFGRPIGSFQAIKHQCADMLLGLEHAKSVAYHAAQVTANDLSDHEAAQVASMAKVICQDAFVHATERNIQIHGGLGFTWEHSAHLYYKRAKANQLMFGDAAAHRGVVAESIGM